VAYADLRQINFDPHMFIDIGYPVLVTLELCFRGSVESKLISGYNCLDVECEAYIKLALWNVHIKIPKLDLSDGLQNTSRFLVPRYSCFVSECASMNKGISGVCVRVFPKTLNSVKPASFAFSTLPFRRALNCLWDCSDTEDSNTTLSVSSSTRMKTCQTQTYYTR
jgi:hypothetical protein